MQEWQHTQRLSQYRGLRAVILTRVSSLEQEKMYGHAAQERQIREKLIEPLGLRIVDEEKHVIHDTYSGLEYRYRKALDLILIMAERQEFDVLCMDVLDRGLGRKALAREMFRMQLRELDIRILTTDPTDHADDDSLEGQILRFIKGYKAEQEVKDFVRRTSDARREKALGNENIKQKVVGNGLRPYGYKFVLDGKGRREGLEPDFTIIHVDATGEEWTEVKVVIFIFESSASGISIRNIAGLLNEKGLPPPFVTKAINAKRQDLLWQPSGVHKILQNSVYWGEYYQFRTITGEKKAGEKKNPRVANAKENQVLIPVPAIVSKELAERVHELLELRQRKASRNNEYPTETLLRVGLIKCARCNGNLTVSRDLKAKDGSGYIRYKCRRESYQGRCKGCTISARIVDAEAWLKAQEIICNPTEVDHYLQNLLVEVSIIKQKQRTLKDLTKIRQEQDALRANLAKVMQKKILDERTVEFLSGQLRLLEQQERDVQAQIADEQALQEKYNTLQQRIVEFHQKCTEWRENLGDPEFTPSYDFKREACEFFGITVIVYPTDHETRFEIEVRPPSIVSIISRNRNRPR